MKKLTLALIPSILALFSFGCNAHRSTAYHGEVTPISSGLAYQNPSFAEYSEDLTQMRSLNRPFHESHSVVETRKMVYQADLTLVVNKPDSAMTQLASIAKKFEGYVLSSGTSGSVIRVKSENLESAISAISGLGKITQKRLTGEDVSDTYQDFQIRLSNSEKARERYLELLGQAENVEAALRVEKELERLNQVIDSLKGQMNRLDHLEAYSTITLTINERKKPGLLGYIGIGLYHSVKWLFVRN